MAIGPTYAYLHLVSFVSELTRLPQSSPLSE